MEKQAFFNLKRRLMNSNYLKILFEYFPEFKFPFDRDYLQNFRSILCKTYALLILKNNSDKKTIHRCSSRQVFFKISQNFLETNCAGVTF